MSALGVSKITLQLLERTPELPLISSHESTAEQKKTDSVFEEESKEQRVVAQCKQAADLTGLCC